MDYEILNVASIDIHDGPPRARINNATNA